jgi:hypothetical protein
VLPGEGSRTHALLGGGRRILALSRAAARALLAAATEVGLGEPAEEGGGGEGSSCGVHAVEGTVGVAGEERGTGVGK